MHARKSHRTLVITAFLCLVASGCQPRGTSPGTPQPTRSQATPAPAPAPPPTPPQPAASRKTRFVLSTAEATPPITQITINGLPADPGYAAPYELTEVTAVQGTAPPTGPYFLFRGVGQKQAGGGVGMSGDPLLGPFFLERLPEGVRLTALAPLGTFQARSKGYMGVGISNPKMTATSPLEYTFFEAAVEGP